MKFPETLITIAGGCIKQLKLEDISEVYVDGLNDPVVNQFLSIKDTEQTLETVSEFVQLNEEAVDGVLWGIWMNDPNRLVGSVRLHGIVSNTGFCHIGICVFDRSAWGRGIASSSITAVTNWAFHCLNLKKIQAGVDPKNIPSRRTFLKAGFQHVSNKIKHLEFSDKDDACDIFVCFPKSHGRAG